MKITLDKIIDKYNMKSYEIPVRRGYGNLYIDGIRYNNGMEKEYIERLEKDYKINHALRTEKENDLGNPDKNNIEFDFLKKYNNKKPFDNPSEYYETD
jgi:hypothetical protein